MNKDSYTWIDKIGFRDADLTTLYLASQYWGIATTLGVGFGDISATNDGILYLKI